MRHKTLAQVRTEACIASKRRMVPQSNPYHPKSLEHDVWEAGFTGDERTLDEIEQAWALKK